jgi:predicted RNase H-like HicB family nuclease
MQYVVVYERTANGWSAYVPDLPGCVAAGDTREEVETLIREAISMHIEALREEGETVPAPGSWTSLVEV